MTQRPLLVVSACFGPARCRYDGELLSSTPTDDILALAKVCFVCPEMAIGLGVPRHPIRLVADGTRIRMVQTVTHADLTEAMEHFCETFLSTLDPAQVNAFILKSRSPSCALTDAKIYAPDRETPIGTGPGLFGAAVLRRFPHTLVIDEQAFADPGTRHHIALRLSGQQKEI